MKYAYLAILIASLTAAYHYGRLAERDKYTEALRASQERTQAVLNELEKAKNDREIIYRDRIKIVKEAKGECLDTAIPDTLFDSLRDDRPGLPPPDPRL